MSCFRLFVLFFCIVVSSASGHAASNPAIFSLTQEDVARIKAFKKLVYEVDRRTIQQTVHELEKTGNPQLNLTLKEAVARTYDDIVKEREVKELKKKEWLYNMVMLNMAYLQFSGSTDSAGSAQALNKLIRKKLKTHLPDDIRHKPGFQVPLG